MPLWDRTSLESWPGKPLSPFKRRLIYQFRLRLGQRQSCEGLGTGQSVVVGKAIQETIEL
jgi:hypothetical protein